MDKIKELAYSIKKEDTLPLKKELLYLYEREAFEKLIYYRQSMRLDGYIIEIIKRLSTQEEEHSYLLQTILENAGVSITGHSKEHMNEIVDEPLDKAIEYDVKEEKISADAYQKAIAKASGNLKKVLEHILQEEFGHVGILEKYLEENQ